MVQASPRNSQGSGVWNVSSEATTWATASAARSSTTVTVSDPPCHALPRLVPGRLPGRETPAGTAEGGSGSPAPHRPQEPPRASARATRVRTPKPVPPLAR